MRSFTVSTKVNIGSLTLLGVKTSKSHPLPQTALMLKTKKIKQKPNQQLAEDGRPLRVPATVELSVEGIVNVMLSTTEAA